MKCLSLLLMLALLVIVGAPVGFTGSADAQSWRQEDPSAIVLPGQGSNQTRRDGGNSIFRIFRFEPDRQSRPSPSVQSAPSGTVLPQIALPPPKDADAMTVVVLGDEFADQMNEGLVDLFDGDRTIQSFGVPVPGSGLTGSAPHDWVVEAPRSLAQYPSVDAVVVALGYSDARPLDDAGQTYAFGTTDWRQFYRNRVTNFALTLIGEGHRVIFVGLPPMADAQSNDEVRLINQMIEEAIAPTRARFVGVYDGFADVEGNYARAGPDLAGQVVNLRNSDGVFFNRAGREKYAHFVERFIPRAGQDVPEPEVSTVIFEGSALSDDGIGPVILLTSGFADPTATLAEDLSDIRPAHIQTRERLLRGTLIAPPQGRADAFAWPPATGG